MTNGQLYSKCFRNSSINLVFCLFNGTQITSKSYDEKQEKKSSDSIMASEIVINYGVNYVQNLSRTKFDHLITSLYI